MHVENYALIEVVRRHLLEDKRLAGQSIDVLSSERHITLVGCVDTEDQKRLALELAEGITGVKDIKNQIVVRTRRTT